MTAWLMSPRFRLGVEGLLGLLLLVLAVRLVLTFIAAPDLGAAPQASFQRADTGVLTRFDPFFRDGPAPRSGGEAGQWTLHAVRAGGGNFDTAIIAGADGRQTVYRVGEALAPGLILASVGADHVQLSRGGALSRLGFADAAEGAARPDSMSPAPVAAPASATPISATRFAAEAALSPRRRGERVDGYVLQPRGRGDALTAAGLQAGDVILSVNGAPMNAERVADLAVELAAGATAEIQYERDGRRHTAVLRIEAGTSG